MSETAIELTPFPSQLQGVEEFMTWVEQYLYPDDMQWMGNDKGQVLPHYRLEAITPYVLSHKRGNQGGLPRRGSK